MIDGRRVIAWTPYGRLNTYSILIEYLRRDVERGVIDEVWLYMNTDPDQEADRRFARKLDKRYPWVHLKMVPPHLVVKRVKQRRTIGAYRYFTDPNAVYIRFDDDIVYVHPDAVETLVRRKVELPHVLACFPIIWNNAICSWFLQQCEVIPRDFGMVGEPYCMDPVGWADGDFAVQIHHQLLDHIESGKVDDLLTYQDWALQVGQQFSVSCFAALGSYYTNLKPPGELPSKEEETHHTVFATRASGQPNMIVGDALVSHYTFRPQQPVMHQHPDILERYRKLAAELTR